MFVTLSMLMFLVFLAHGAISYKQESPSVRVFGFLCKKEILALKHSPHNFSSDRVQLSGPKLSERYYYGCFVPLLQIEAGGRGILSIRCELSLIATRIDSVFLRSRFLPFSTFPHSFRFLSSFLPSDRLLT